MKLKLNNDADVFKADQLAGLQNSRSLTASVAALVDTTCTDLEQDCEVTVAKALLPDSYKGNPSLFACKVLATLGGEWLDSSGWQTHNKRTHVTIKLLRQAKPEHARRGHANPSIKQLVKQWLELNLPSNRKFVVPLAAIPAFYASHPEQLTYAIKQETGTPIRIRRATTTWIFARK